MSEENAAEHSAPQCNESMTFAKGCIPTITVYIKVKIMHNFSSHLQALTEKKNKSFSVKIIHRIQNTQV